MKVYRLESAKGEGVFNAGIVYDARNAVNDRLGYDTEPCPYRHPAPHDDVPGWYAQKNWISYHCGFRSVEHLLAWFDSEAIRVEMNKLGARMKVFEVNPDYVMEGTAQIMFRKDLALLVDTQPVPTIAA